MQIDKIVRYNWEIRLWHFSVKQETYLCKTLQNWPCTTIQHQRFTSCQHTLKLDFVRHCKIFDLTRGLSKNVWIGIVKPLQETINTSIGRVLISYCVQGEVIYLFVILIQIGNIRFVFVFVKVYETSKKYAKRLGEFSTKELNVDDMWDVSCRVQIKPRSII